MTIGPWFLVAMLMGATGYGTYLIGLRRHLVEPNRASWLIWSAATGVEAATYAAVNPGAPQGIVFMLSAAACIVVTVVMWRRSRWRTPTPSESICMTAAFAAITLWLFFDQALWAHLLVVAAVPISFWPTWGSVIEDRTRERSPAWGLWTLGDLATLLLCARNESAGVGEYAYILVELLCHASVWLMVGIATINPVRSIGFRRGRFLVLEVDRAGGNPFAVGETHLGKAVYAAQGFAKDERIIRFSGPRIAAARMHRGLRGAADRFVQIAADRYMGPSGRIDDLINHSCSPNAGLRFADGQVFLIAIRDIAPGEEIAWDYATTLRDPDWRMPCECGSPECRGVIGDFDTLPAERQDWYRAQDLVAPYLRVESADAERAA